MSAIAIVGMGCRFAGAPDLQAYWKLTVEGRDSFEETPAMRWPKEAFHSTQRRATDKTYTVMGGWVDDIESFPALALGLPPRRVEAMDPQQRLALMCSIEAIEDAGYTPSEVPNRTGVFLGITAHEYRVLQALRLGAAWLGAVRLWAVRPVGRVGAGGHATLARLRRQVVSTTAAPVMRGTMC